MWAVIENDETVHVAPRDIEHDVGHMEFGLWCHCSPEIQMEHEKPLVVHNVFSGN